MDDSPEFTVADHTKIVKAVLDHPLQVIKYLDRKQGHDANHLEIMDAALKVQCFDSDTKRLLRIARDAGVRHADLLTATDGPVATRRQQVRTALEGKTIPDMIVSLDRLLQQETDDGAVAGFRLARDILIDGAGTIYSPRYAANEYLDTVGGRSGSDDDPPHTPGYQHVAQTDAEIGQVATSVGGQNAGGALAGLASVGAAIHVIQHAFFD